MNTSPSIEIENLIKEYSELKKFLLESGQVSYESFMSDIFRKHLLMSCASLFEVQIQDIIVKFVESYTDNASIHSLVKMKVISRQYHTYFDWKDKRAGPFYSLFGEPFKTSITEKLKNTPELKQAEKDFLEIGSERNLLAHENFLNYSLNKTPEDILTLYRSATSYIEFIKNELI